VGSSVSEDHVSAVFSIEASQIGKVAGCIQVGKNVCLEEGGNAFQTDSNWPDPRRAKSKTLEPSPL